MRLTPTTPAQQAFAAMALVLAEKPLTNAFAPHWLLRRHVDVPAAEREAAARGYGDRVPPDLKSGNRVPSHA